MRPEVHAHYVIGSRGYAGYNDIQQQRRVIHVLSPTFQLGIYIFGLYHIKEAGNSLPGRSVRMLPYYAAHRVYSFLSFHFVIIQPQIGKRLGYAAISEALFRRFSRNSLAFSRLSA